MADEVSPEIIQSTQKLLGKHVTKPQLSEKLLKKPPFRFLHDIVNVLVRDSGFLKGLYTEDELNSGNVKDREAKIVFLNKLIAAVKTISGKDLQAKSSKIIAGLDATETNRLLQTIGRLIDDKVDTKEYVKTYKKSAKGEKDAPSGAIIKKSSSNAGDKLNSSRQPDKTDKESTIKKKSTITTTTPKAKESISSKTKETRADTKKKTSKVDKLSNKSSVGSKDEKDSTRSKTVSNAKQNSKISPKERSPSTTTTKPSKSKRSPRENKSVEESPRFELHIEKDVEDSRKPQVLTEESQRNAETRQTADALENTIEKPDSDLKLNEVNNDDANGDISAEPVSTRMPSARPKSARPRSGSNDPRPQSNQPQEPPKEQTKKTDAIKPMMPTVDFSMKNTGKDTAGDISASNLAKDTNKEPDEKKSAAPFRPKSSLLRPPSVRPTSARPGAPRLRPETSVPMKEIMPVGKINVIVENFDRNDGEKQDEDEEETVVIQAVPDDNLNEPAFLQKGLDIPADKGHLVEQILEQMQAPNGSSATMDDIKGQFDWENEGIKGKDAFTKEINALRASIQALTRTANPLGKLTSYLHEDVEAMHSELETWLNMKNQYTHEIAMQNRGNIENNQPLLNQLRNLEENIKKERDEIANVKYNILKNEHRIKDLVNKQIRIE